MARDSQSIRRINEQTMDKNKNVKNRIFITIFCLALFSTMIILGISNGEVGIMFKKAVSICLECIGIGH